MGFSSPLGNMMHFVGSRPPLVVFTMCLASFALTTYSLAYYIKRSENVFNPDYPLDWNNFLSHLTQLSLCLNGLNETESDLLPQLSDQSNFTPIILEERMNNSQLLFPLTFVHAKRMSGDFIGRNTAIISLEVSMSLALEEGLSSSLQNLSVIQGVIQARQLRLNRPDGREDASLLNMTLYAAGGLWAQAGKAICMTLEGPVHLLPASSSPRECHMDNVTNKAGATFTAYEQVKSDGACGEGIATASIEYSPDSDVSFFLTARDRSLINLHLLHTSYFLFVMVMTMACYGLLKGRSTLKQDQPSDTKHTIDA